MRNVAPLPAADRADDAAAVRLGDRGDDREAEPDAAARSRARLIGAVEALEHALAALLAQARARRPPPRSRRSPLTRPTRHVHGRSRRRVRADVARAGCRRPAAAGRDRRARRRRRRRARSAASGSTIRAVSTASPTTSSSSTGSRSSGRPSSSRASSSRSSTSRLMRSDSRRDSRHRAREVVGPAVGAAREQLGVCAHGGERRAQLVRGVGDEAPQLPLGCLARLERRFDLAEHRVEREAEPADLGALAPRARRAARDRPPAIAPAVFSIASQRTQAETHDPEAERAERARARARSRAARSAAAGAACCRRRAARARRRPACRRRPARSMRARGNGRRRPARKP